MAQMNLQIPDNQLDRVVKALCFGIMAPDAFSSVEPTPALAKKVVIDMIKEKVRVYEQELVKRNNPIDVDNIIA
jgi:hypothetical protein